MERGLTRDFFCLCDNMSPSPSEKRGGIVRETNVHDPILGCVTYTNCSNHFVEESIVGAKKLIVMGGTVANGGEAQLSRLVLRNKDTLEEIRYFPVRTKGGLFIRPYYDTPRPDCRTKQCKFPNMKTIHVNANGVPTLMSTYILPSIETIHIGVNEGYVNDDAFKALSDKLFGWYPSLKLINCFVEFGTIYEITKSI